MCDIGENGTDKQECDAAHHRHDTGQVYFQSREFTIDIDAAKVIPTQMQQHPDTTQHGVNEKQKKMFEIGSANAVCILVGEVVAVRVGIIMELEKKEMVWCESSYMANSVNQLHHTVASTNNNK